MTIEKIKQIKEDYGFTCQMIADASGVPMSTVLKIMSGKNKCPRYSTMEKLNLGVNKLIQADRMKMYVNGMAEAKKRLESPEKKGGNTIEDYMALPEGERVELIDGVFYDLSSTLGPQQLSLDKVTSLLADYIEKYNVKCKVFHSPMDVQLDADDKTVVQPDAFILCDRDKYVDGKVIGAPDLVIEVLSPSNRWHDMGRKLRKYKLAGVREYWVIDTEKEVVIVHTFENDDYSIYSFNDKVPVGIWGGKCKVDFKAVKKYMEW